MRPTLALTVAVLLGVPLAVAGCTVVWIWWGGQ